MTSTLSQKEKLFCFYYLSTSNVRESALKSGYRINPERTGIKLLEKKRIRKHLSFLRESVLDKKIWSIKSGYERLAFGSIEDPIHLLFTKELNLDTLKNFDLFNISEIKKLKDGGMEIKFFDRFKALEKLAEIEESNNQNTRTVYEALINSTNSSD